MVLEGGDAVGKSTQVELLATRLRARGRTVVTTREPGGTALGAAIRAAFLDGTAPVDPIAEVLLVAGDRAQHVAEVVRPALERGDDVVSDRYTPSSLVYQGIARGVGVAAVDAMCEWATGGLQPDAVIVLDVASETASRRRAVGRDRLEREGDAFRDAVREGYRELAADRGWVLVDGSDGPEAVAEGVWAAVLPVLTQP